MSKQYKVDMNLDTSRLHPSGGLLMKQVPKEADPNNPDQEFDARGFKEQTGSEIFEYICRGAINGANQRVSFDQLKSFRKVAKRLAESVEKSVFIGNKTEIDMIKHSVKGNTNWPNTDEMFDLLEQLVDKLENAELIGEQNPSSDA